MNSLVADGLPILYSFRRCPYAMRARMALAVANISYEIREIALRDKPIAMLAASPKGTVPVLVLQDRVIDESLDVMLWVLKQNDPEHWLAADELVHAQMLEVIERNDGPFKFHLDRMKYSTRYPGADPAEHRAQATGLLLALEQRLSVSAYLFGRAPTLADIAIFPFVRQFAHADTAAFSVAPLKHTQIWLAQWEASSLFKSVMVKHPEWRA